MLIYILMFLSVIAVIVNLKKTSEKKEEFSAADITGIMHFLHGFSSLCTRHEIVGTDVLISWVKSDTEYEITAYTKIFKIDGEDAAEAVDVLRRSISWVKDEVEVKNPDADSVEIYKLQSEAEDRAVLNFFGADHLTGTFWDIRDCDYIDNGRYIEFEDHSKVYSLFNQSLSKTLDAICTQTKEKYNNVQIDRQKNMIKISFN